MIFSFIGPRGAGKTTIVRRLADVLDAWKVISTDELIESSAQKSIPQIVADEGWAGFRRRESRALMDCLHIAEEASGVGALLDTGGGIVMNENNRKLLRDHSQVVYLIAEPEILVSRIKEDENRPDLTNAASPLAEMKQVLAERKSLYQKIANLEIDTGDLGLEACITIIHQWVIARCGTCEL